jgi:hypothetical protein
VRRVIGVPSRIGDVYRLARLMRPADRAEATALGLDPRVALRECFRQALLRRTYFVDGEIAAMVGLCGAMISDEGEPYLVTTPAVMRVKVSFLKEARKTVAEMLAMKRRLVGEVDASYSGACRLLEMIGFTLGAPHARGPRGDTFRTFTLEVGR